MTSCGPGDTAVVLVHHNSVVDTLALFEPR